MRGMAGIRGRRRIERRVMERKEMVSIVVDPCQDYEFRIRTAVDFIQGLTVQSLNMAMAHVWSGPSRLPVEVFDVVCDAFHIVQKMAEYRQELDKEVRDVV